MAAKKDPYGRIQKRFVQARAGDVAYEDLTPEEREQYQNRFNMLSQTVEGRGKIARRILGPEATQEQRQNLRQRIKQNLPRTETTQPTTPPEEETPAGFTSFAGRRGSPSIAARPTPTFAGRRGSPSIAARPTTEVTSKKQDSGRIGSGYFSIPKNPVQLLKEVGQEFKTQGEYYARVYLNPALNIGLAGLEKLGGGNYKYKKFAEPTKGEIITESALTVAGGLAGPVLGAASRGAASAAGAIGSSLVRRGAVAAGTPLVNVSQRAAALRLVQQAAARQQLGERAVVSAAGAMDDIIRTQAPKPSGVSRPSAPTRGAKVATVSAEEVVSAPKTPKPKAAAKTPKPKAAPKAKVATAPTTKGIEVATEKYAPGFNKNFGDIEMQSTTYEPIEVVVKQPETTKAPKAPKAPKPSSVTPIAEPKVTTKGIEAKTEKYAPGFNKEVGAMEMRSTQYEPIELAPSAEKINNALDQVEKILKQPEIQKIVETPVAEVKTPQPAKAPRKTTQKKSQVATPKPASQQQATVTPEDIEFARRYPSSAKGREIDRLLRGIKEYVPPTGPKLEMPAPKQFTAKVEQSSSDIIARQEKTNLEFRVSQQKLLFPGFEPRKVTKLPKREQTLNKLEERGSMLFRMYDEGAGSRSRPRGAAETEIQRGTPIQNQLDDVVDTMQGGGSGTFRFGEVPVDSKAVEKEIERTMIRPNVVIQRGEAINPRYQRRAQPTIPGEMPMPTLMSKGVEEFKPTRMPLSTEAGLSAEQRLAKLYREEFPEARSARQARKLYEQSMGRQDPITTIGELGKTGSPLGGLAKPTPSIPVEIKKPIKYEKVIKNGKTVYKPVAFKTEVVPGIETLAGPVPVEELPQRWNVSPEAIQSGRKASKAETLKSRAKQAQRLRGRGIRGEAEGQKLQQTLDEIKKGKAFQRGFDDLARKNKK